jgi:hypothetical protein
MDLQEAWGFRMICKLDLSFPPALDLMSIRTLQGEILPLWPGYLPTLEVKPQSKLFSSPAASKESLVHPLYDTTPPQKKNSFKDQPPAQPPCTQLLFYSIHTGRGAQLPFSRLSWALGGICSWCWPWCQDPISEKLGAQGLPRRCPQAELGPGSGPLIYPQPLLGISSAPSCFPWCSPELPLHFLSTSSAKMRLPVREGGRIQESQHLGSLPEGGRGQQGYNQNSSLKIRRQ